MYSYPERQQQQQTGSVSVSGLAKNAHISHLLNINQTHIFYAQAAMHRKILKEKILERHRTKKEESFNCKAVIY